MMGMAIFKQSYSVCNGGIRLFMWVYCIGHLQLRSSRAEEDESATGPIRTQFCWPSSTNLPNTDKVIQDLVNASQFQLYANSSNLNVSSGSLGIYGAFQCLGSLSLEHCSQCVPQLASLIRNNCRNALEALTLSDACLLEISVTYFFKLNTQRFLVACNSTTTLQTSASTSWFVPVLNASIDHAPLYGGYASAIGAGNKSFALAQCFGYLSPQQCSQCLVDTYASRATGCGNAAGAIVVSMSCYYRYQEYLFFTPTNDTLFLSDATQTPAVPNITGKSLRAIVSIAIGAASLLLLSLCAFVAVLKYCRRKGGMKIEQLFEEKKPVIFSLRVLKMATRNFHPDNMIGEGGFGIVYKGRLRHGRDVAVKRLSLGDSQGKHQFLNEVEFLTTARHKNIVRLFGCCAEDAERLLVYEYFENKSLDYFLFDPDALVVDWATRVQIISGIAHGLAYLHEDSHVPIIHRDIKAANILLDNEMNPKIADFGIAKLLETGKSHLNTGVAGTLGYLAPEYALEGHLSEKADVYSYGVLLLEIVSGRSNFDTRLSSQRQHLLGLTWRVYQEHISLVQLIDPKLPSNSNLIIEEVTRVVHIALLCTQASHTLRPTMTNVVTMLSQSSEILETQIEAPFVTPIDHEQPFHQEVQLDICECN